VSLPEAARYSNGHKVNPAILKPAFEPAGIWVSGEDGYTVLLEYTAGIGATKGTSASTLVGRGG